MSQRYAYKRAFLNKTKDVKSYSDSDLSQILGYSVVQDNAPKAQGVFFLLSSQVLEGPCALS